MSESCPAGSYWAGSKWRCQTLATILGKRSQKHPGSVDGETQNLPGVGTVKWNAKVGAWQLPTATRAAPASTAGTGAATRVAPASTAGTGAATRAAPASTAGTGAATREAPAGQPPKGLEGESERDKGLRIWALTHQRMLDNQKVIRPGNYLDYQKAILNAARKGESIPSREAFREKTRINNSYEYNDAFDLVLEYLLSQGHVDTLDEALYVMMEMSSETIQDICEGAKVRLPGEPGETPSSGYKQPILPGEQRLTKQSQEKLPKPGSGSAPLLPGV